MASERQLAANRRNAKKSRGPTSDAGKRRSRDNALRHGLATSLNCDPLLRADVERMAQIVSRGCNEANITLGAQHAAEAEIDLLRISKIRVSIYAAFHATAKSVQDLTQMNEDLAKLDRYERRAFSRRRRALSSI